MKFKGQYSGKGFSVMVSGGAVRPPGGNWSGYFEVHATLAAEEGQLALPDGSRWRVWIEPSPLPQVGPGPPPKVHRYTFQVVEILA